MGVTSSRPPSGEGAEFSRNGIALTANGGAAATGPLLERRHELARIEVALAEARMGRGTLVVIEGPAGIG